MTYTARYWILPPTHSPIFQLCLSRFSKSTISPTNTASKPFISLVWRMKSKNLSPGTQECAQQVPTPLHRKHEVHQEKDLELAWIVINLLRNCNHPYNLLALFTHLSKYLPKYTSHYFSAHSPPPRLLHCSDRWKVSLMHKETGNYDLCILL